MKYRHIDDPKFLFLMISMAEASDQVTTDVKNAVYATAFEDVEISVLETAVWEMLRARKFSTFPKIGEVLEHVHGRPEDMAELEASKVWDTVKRHGGWKSVVFDDPVTMAVIHHGFGGWSKMCGELMDDQQKWFIKDFTRMYSAFHRQGVKHYGELLGRAPGEAILIGNPEKAMEVKLLAAENNQNVKLLVDAFILPEDG